MTDGEQMCFPIQSRPRPRPHEPARLARAQACGLSLLAIGILSMGCRVEETGLGRAGAAQVAPVVPGPGRPPLTFDGGASTASEGTPPGELDRDGAADEGLDAQPSPSEAADAQGAAIDALADGTAGAGEDAGAPRVLGLERGLVLWLALDGPAGAAAARDDSGRRNPVRLLGLDAGLAWVPGRIGGALDLASSPTGTGHLRAETSASINQIGSEITIALWLSRPAGRAGVILSRRASAAGGSLYRLEATADDQLRLVLNDRRGVRLSLPSAARMPADRWVHLAVTADERQARLYVDGRLEGEAAYGVPIATDVSPLLIGATEAGDSGALAGFLSGRLDELLIYHRALTEVEVSALASGALPPARD